MTQVFRVMCAAAAFALAFSIQTASAQQQQPVKKTDSSRLSNQREAVKKKNLQTTPALQDAGSQRGGKREEKHRRSHTIVDLPGYPAYVTTGNPQADEKAYLRAKAAWMKENPQLYKDYLKKEAEKSPRPSVASRRAANPKN